MAPHLCVGLGEAARIAKLEMQADAKYISKLNYKLYTALRQNVGQVEINGDLFRRYHGNLNISLAGVSGGALMESMRDLAFSAGQACNSESAEPSYVLTAIGVERDLANSSIRLGLGRFTTEEEVEHTIQLITKTVMKLRHGWEAAP